MASNSSHNMDLRTRVQDSVKDLYRIERELGGGGMSRVFLAEEHALGRRVVIKVLPLELAGGVSIDRFRREISFAARLQHPHIVPLFAAGEAGGLPYFTMPFVEGQTLRERLARGELPVAEVIATLRDVAKALAHAHSRNTIHRDIKPDNILLSGRAATVTDFGVAKALSAASLAEGQTTLTELGVTLGTPAYMSPEQVAADPSIDHRADIYALGIVGYEMLVGRTPFGDRSTQQLLAAHIAEAPTPVDTLRPSVPVALARIIMRCLEKRPADRFQSADGLLQALEAVATADALTGAAPLAAQSFADESLRRKRLLKVGAIAAGILVVASAAMLAPQLLRSEAALNPNRLAVMPFTNATGDSTLNAIGLMAADWTASGLTELDSIEVGSFSSATEVYLHMKKDGPVLAQAFGRRTSAGRVVTGSLHRSGSSILVQPEIVDAMTGRVLRAFEPIPVSPENPEPGIDEVRQRVMSAVSLGSEMLMSRRPPKYAAYLRYLAGDDMSRRSDFRGSIVEMRAAIALDTTFYEAVSAMVIDLANTGQWYAADTAVTWLEQRVDRMSSAEREGVVRGRAFVSANLEGIYQVYRSEARRDSTVHPLYGAAFGAMITRRLEEAAATFAMVKDDERSDGWYQPYRYEAAVNHALGHHRTEYEVLRRGRNKYPTNAVLFRQELSTLAAMGSLERVDAIIDSVLAIWTPSDNTAPYSYYETIQAELRAHGRANEADEYLKRALDWLASRDGQPDATLPTRLEDAARLLFVADNADSARKLVLANPNNYFDTSRTVAGTAADSTRLDRVGWTGMIEAKAGNAGRADSIVEYLGNDRRPYTRGKPAYQAARILAVLGKEDAAVAELRTAFSQGYRWSHELHTEPAFALLRKNRSFLQLTSPRK